jgi:hypothetical protein
MINSQYSHLWKVRLDVMQYISVQTAKKLEEMIVSSGHQAASSADKTRRLERALITPFSKLQIQSMVVFNSV